MLCTNCGKDIPSGAKFCTECGTKISVAAAPPCESCSEHEPTTLPEIEHSVSSTNTDAQIPPPIETEPVSMETNVSTNNAVELPSDKAKSENDFCFCEKCRMILKPNTEICPVCGSWVGDSSKKPGADIIYCPNCWNTVKPGQKFCTNCGATITEQSNTPLAAVSSDQKLRKSRFSIPIPLSIRYSSVFMKLEELFGIISTAVQKLPHKKAILAGALALVILVSGVAVFFSSKDSNSDKGGTSWKYELTKGSDSDKGNISQKYGLTVDEAFALLMDRPFGKYGDVPTRSLFGAIGAKKWVLISIGATEIRAKVIGKDMSFFVIFDLNTGTHKLESIQIGNTTYTGRQCVIMSENLLNSAYDACKAGYHS